ADPAAAGARPTTEERGTTKPTPRTRARRRGVGRGGSGGDGRTRRGRSVVDRTRRGQPGTPVSSVLASAGAGSVGVRWRAPAGKALADGMLPHRSLARSFAAALALAPGCQPRADAGAPPSAVLTRA